MGSTEFFGSQVGGQTVINYAYTDLPSRLLMWDIYYFFHYVWALPWILWPIMKAESGANSGDLDELAPTWRNAFCCIIHAVLVVLQLLFILSLPFLLLLPVWTAALGVMAFFAVNWALCLLLNGPSLEYHSDPKYAPARPEHAHEQWIFLNGVAVGDHWMKNNLNRLALTFKRPVLGIHNQTSGILFDVVECLIQRNFGYATFDVRMAYRVVKEKLYDPRFSKVIFILHSQGGIEGGLVLDWLLQELPQDLLSKLEVYTFGNAANHFNNPHRHVLSQKLTRDDPLAALSTLATETVSETPSSSTPPLLDPDDPAAHFFRKTAVTTTASVVARPNGDTTTKPTTNGDVKVKEEEKEKDTTPLPPVPSMLKTNSSSASAFSSSSTTRTSTAARDRALGHAEHYAHTTDFVALWGILHFCTSLAAQRTMPRFIGRLFARASDRGGHQFCQHYLNGMFPLARDPDTGALVGADEENNEFMESEVQVGRGGASGQNAREAFEISWLGAAGFGSGDVPAEVEVHGAPKAKLVMLRRGVSGASGSLSSSELSSSSGAGVVKVKDLSRLWMYRNGKSPPGAPPLLVNENGVVRNQTM